VNVRVLESVLPLRTGGFHVVVTPLDNSESLTVTALVYLVRAIVTVALAEPPRYTTTAWGADEKVMAPPEPSGPLLSPPPPQPASAMYEKRTA
jgi:hypothetical protein